MCARVSVSRGVFLGQKPRRGRGGGKGKKGVVGAHHVEGVFAFADYLWMG